MISMINELYLGNIGLYTAKRKSDAAYSEAFRLFVQIQEKLLPLLNEKGQETLERLCEASTQMEEASRREAFTYGIRVGLLLMAESLYGPSDLLTEELI